MKSVLNDERLVGVILPNITGKCNRKPLTKRGNRQIYTMSVAS